MGQEQEGRREWVAKEAERTSVVQACALQRGGCCSRNPSAHPPHRWDVRLLTDNYSFQYFPQVLFRD